MHHSILLLILLAAFAATALAGRLIDRTPLTLPMIFAALGLLLATPINDLAQPHQLSAATRLLAEITLIVVLFADASHIRFSRFRHMWQKPARMLIIGLPLTVGLGTLVAYLVAPGAGIAMAVLTAAVLTPTDAALAQSVVENDDLPVALRQTIVVESGLNDGLVLPFVLLGALLVSSTSGHEGTDGLAIQSLWQVVLAPVIGGVVGAGMARLSDAAQTRGFARKAAGGIVFLSTAFGAYLLSETLGGNGFIAAFVAGMTFGNLFADDMGFVADFMDDIGILLTMSAFVIFGAVLLPQAFDHVTAPVFLLAVLFLTIVRIVPIYLSLLGSDTHPRERLFLGWAGPRGWPVSSSR
ncbi:cation:proton antiporter [Sulfitobacter aestuariivivens]|uniref:cation:proton antiporter n=1 Tax=Sulfitobacter aestuariivivens TaxID=2766981 RepID=UPI0036140DBA